MTPLNDPSLEKSEAVTFEKLIVKCIEKRRHYEILRDKCKFLIIRLENVRFLLEADMEKTHALLENIRLTFEKAKDEEVDEITIYFPADRWGFDNEDVGRLDELISEMESHMKDIKTPIRKLKSNNPNIETNNETIKTGIYEIIDAAEDLKRCARTRLRTPEYEIPSTRGI